MKVARIGFMIIGIAMLMFLVAPYASAQAVQGIWFKGSVSLKGYEVNDDTGAATDKSSGKGTVYVNIVSDTGVYTVTTCMEDRDTDGVWNLGEPSTITTDKIYTDPGNKYQIWDFFLDKSAINFYGPAYIYPMFKVTTNGNLTKASFKSFACVGVDETDNPVWGIGACTMSFKNIDPTKVPHAGQPKVTQGCY